MIRTPWQNGIRARRKRKRLIMAILNSGLKGHQIYTLVQRQTLVYMVYQALLTSGPRLPASSDTHYNSGGRCASALTFVVFGVPRQVSYIADLDAGSRECDASIRSRRKSSRWKRHVRTPLPRRSIEFSFANLILHATTHSPSKIFRYRWGSVTKVLSHRGGGSLGSIRPTLWRTVYLLR